MTAHHRLSDFRSVDRLGPQSFRVETPTGQVARLTAALPPRAEECAERIRRSVQFRLQWPKETLPPTVARLLSHGWLVTDVGRVACMLTDFVAGDDLNTLATKAELPGAAVLARALREALTDWHRPGDGHLAGFASIGTARAATSWHAHITSWAERWLRQAENSGIRITEPGGRLVSQVARPLGGRPMHIRLLHNDLHGGNVVARSGTAAGPLVVVPIDERLTLGDPAFDTASLVSWALEVLPGNELPAFLRALVAPAVPDRGASDVALVKVYLAERSLGRVLLNMTRSDDPAKAVSERIVELHAELIRHMDRCPLWSGGATQLLEELDHLCEVRKRCVNN